LRDRWTLGFRRLPRKRRRRRRSSGDGRLACGEEKIFEAYYSYKLNRWSALTFDYQFIADPAYNADRGPVSIFSARAHAEF
jgi:high affinity Mn2+ porin